MRTRRVPAALGALLVAGLLAAGVGVGPSAAPAGARTNEQTSEQTGTDSPAAPEIDVLERGATPRTDLRFTVAAGAEETLRMRTYARISQTTDGQTRTGSTPNITFTIAASVDSVDADGNLTITYAYVAIDVADSTPASLSEQTRDALEPLIGVSGVMVITDKGVLLSNDLTIPSDLDPQAQQLLDQLQSQSSALTVPFPDATVGVGGRWRATTEAELGGITFRQRATYTVERIEDGRTTLSVTLRQSAPRQRFTAPGTDTEVLLLSSVGTGRGETIVAPDTAVMPVGGQSDIRTRQRLEADGQRLSQTTSVALFLNERR